MINEKAIQDYNDDMKDRCPKCKGKGYDMVMINPDDISHETNSKSHKGIYYFGETHYVIIKGFAQIDDSLYFTTFDPFSLHEKYEDGSFKGKNRYYNSNDIINTIKNTNTDIYIIKQSRTISLKKANELSKTHSLPLMLPIG